MPPWVAAFLIISLTVFHSGCISLSSSPRVKTSCSVEQTWSAALASVDEFELRRIDQETGVIETDWIAARPLRQAGALQRDVNEERARFILTLTPDQDGSLMTVHQLREFWSPMGVQSRSWRRTPPRHEEERRLATRIEKRLHAKGCS